MRSPCFALFYGGGDYTQDLGPLREEEDPACPHLQPCTHHLCTGALQTNPVTPFLKASSQLQ